MKTSRALALALSGCAALALRAQEPRPYGAAPSERQLRWHETETFSLIHYGLNTYTDREWGYGEENPALFNPAKLDAGQVITALKRGGMNGVILVAKHHDGFCLWPTKTTGHNIAKSPWRGGRGDLVREYADAAKKHGVRFGVYCSPWDRNSAAYGTPAYPPLYQAQLRELLTQYGTLFEVWFDGANGGDGFYGGAREKRSIDRFTYYDWPGTWGLVRQLQPSACIFGDVGPDCRWVGNEKGYAAEESWATFTPKGKTDPARPANGDSMNHIEGPAGHRNGAAWIPAECDVPLRKGWFWHTNEDATVRTPAQLLDIYFNSVGKGGCMNLGVAPDRDGRVCEADIRSLDVFGGLLRTLFAANLASSAVAVADNVRAAQTAPEQPSPFAPANVLDRDRYSYWATDDGVTNATLTLTLPAVAEFNVVRLRENIKLGHRVDGFAVETWQDGQWREYAKGQSIGACRLFRGTKVKTDRVRLRITGAAACPCVSDIGLFAMPAAFDQKP
ncbi:MAG TPA: alpha-L-fucosidase [Kiritimatiellia bacterium]|nr:alpha-L-fucosidase [Kiritimatiellia bacterium]HPS07910.1 alpha-L-fucosidase [Kiritimatiellia bacterium]